MEAALRLHDWWVNRHPLLRVFMVLAVLGALGYFLAPIGISAFRDWRATRTAEEARVALERGDHVAARDLALQVIRADREGSEEVFPVLMRAGDILGDTFAAPAAATVWRSEVAESERLEAWNVLARRMPTAPLLGLYGAAGADLQQRPEVVGPLIDRALDEGNLRLVGELLGTLPRPLDDAIEARRLRALSESSAAEDRSDFIRGLVTATYEREDSDALWLELLARVPGSEFTGRVAEAFGRFLDRFPEDDVAAGLQRGRLRMATDPARADYHFIEAYERYGDQAPWQTARWCRELGRDSWARERVPLDVPSEEPDHLKLQVALLRDANQAEEAAGLLEAAAAVKPDGWRSGLWRCWAAALRGDEETQEREASRTLEREAENSRAEAPLELAREAGRLGFDALARDAWALAYQRGVGPLPLAASMGRLLPALEAEGEEDALIAVMSRLSEFEPGNPLVQRHFAYLRLTNGLADPGTIIEELQPIQQRQPESMSLRIVLSLAHLLAGQTARAAELTEVEDVDWFGVPDNARALRVAVLRAVGRGEEAEIYAEGLDIEALLPSEQRLYEALLED